MRSLFLFIPALCLSAHAQSTLEASLKQAIYQQNLTAITTLLAQYQTKSNVDPILVRYANAKVATLKEDYSQAISLYRHILAQKPELNSIRMELAKALFADHQDSNALAQLNKIKTAQDLPTQAYSQIDQYLEALNQRNDWQFNGSLAYLQTNNVANVSDSVQIEETGFRKNQKMLPQKAHGIRYYVGISKDFNLSGSHYLSVENDTVGKLFWDNHAFDDINNHTKIGYAYKKSDYTLRLQPFYEKRWYGGHRYHWSNGISLNNTLWLSANWQNYAEVTLEHRRFFKDNEQNGHIRSYSDTLLWLPNPKQLFYAGVTFSQEKTTVRQYGSNLLNFRIGWLQEYSWGISSKIAFGFTKRKFYDEAILGGMLPLGKTRKDRIYTLNLQLWKQDWHILGITPKINMDWKQQISNLDTMYSYQDQSITLLFEKSF